MVADRNTPLIWTDGEQVWFHYCRGENKPHCIIIYKCFVMVWWKHMATARYRGSYGRHLFNLIRVEFDFFFLLLMYGDEIIIVTDWFVYIHMPQKLQATLGTESRFLKYMAQYFGVDWTADAAEYIAIIYFKNNMTDWTTSNVNLTIFQWHILTFKERSISSFEGE